MMRAGVRSILSALSGNGRRLLIFTYHRILPAPDPLLSGEPTEADFRQQAAFIAEYLNVLPLVEAIERMDCGTLPPRAACVTFDDGYRNNFEIAAPILDEYGLTATFFVTTGAVAAGGMFNDCVIETVRAAPNQLDLREFGLDTWDCTNDANRARTIHQLLERLKYRSHCDRERVAQEMYQWAVPDRPLDLMMTAAMIKTLAARGFEIGGHTVTHPILAGLDEQAACAEIADGRDWLANVTGERPRTFAYPNGRPGIDFLPEHAKLVEDLGFRCAVSTRWAVAAQTDSRFALPRLTPWELREKSWVARVAKSYLSSWVYRGQQVID